MELLSKKQLAGQPIEQLCELPERVLQFGSGVLLRALPDYLIDRANRKGIFNGRVVVVKSTDRGDRTTFDDQDCLYTICTRGLENGQIVHQNAISTAISRVLPADGAWAEVLACATNPLLRVVISNTTEVGIEWVEEAINQNPPSSFPAKLLAFLHARYHAFDGDPAMGMVIVPTELITDNGQRLKTIILALAHFNKLVPAFVDWLENACVFCNSLVDRIVPGVPAADKLEEYFQELGYRDALLTTTEPYCFWAIEGDERVAAALSFQKAAPDAVVITPDISHYLERKLRLLNGTHTLSCGLAHLAGFNTVSEAMNNADMLAFVEQIMRTEIIPSIPCELPAGDAENFGRQVLDRFRNPFVDHRWLSISAQYTMKMQSRIVPLLQQYYRKHTSPPPGLALGFAALLVFQREVATTIPDEAGDYFFQLWQKKAAAPQQLVQEVLANTSLWKTDLTLLPGFAAAVSKWVSHLLEHGAGQTIPLFLSQKNEKEHPTNTLVG